MGCQRRVGNGSASRRPDKVLLCASCLPGNFFSPNRCIIPIYLTNASLPHLGDPATVWMLRGRPAHSLLKEIGP